MELSVLLATIMQSKMCILRSDEWYLSNVSQCHTQGIEILS